MPTREELAALGNHCSTSWATRDLKQGCLVTGNNDNSIFLPAAGYQSEMGRCDDYQTCDYWSSTLYTADSQYGYYLYSSNYSSFSFEIVGNGVYRWKGLSVRPVTE
jgi:hypothetical protein